MKPAPTFSEVEAKLTALIAGHISRDEADRWAGQWVYASELTEMPPAVWSALLLLAGCDLRHGPGEDYLHTVEQFEEWLAELRAHGRAATLASQRLLALPLPDGASRATRGEAILLLVRRSTLEVVVTVPVTVREWFVEAKDTASGMRVEDWCDYDGYDDSPTEQLERDMADDVSQFVQRLLTRDLRLVVEQRSVQLLWKVKDSWQRAVPIDESAV